VADLLDRLKAALSDRYRIERELGSGGMATVYLAEDLKHDRKVAVKVLRPELAAALGPERFHQEIKIAANLTHPHILPLHDSGDADGFLYYVMPHIEGESLREKLAHEGELPISEAVRILRDVVDALSHAHKHGVVHRDIKPDNVLLSERHALVTDFGVAKAVSEATGAHKLTTEGVALGTPAYMSPEQAAADKHIDHRADIYAVGALAYELLTGRPPFTGNTPQEVLSAQVTQAPEPVTKHRATVPPALAQVVMKCLEKKAADRWQTAEELLPQLEALATPSGGITPTGTMPVDRLVKRRWMIAGAGAALAAVIAVIVVMAALPLWSDVALDPDRVLVAVFENQTGDPSLDPLGTMAGHWITQGLQKSGVVQVVPWVEAQQASQYVASEADAGNVRYRVTALAEETGAGTVISGAYYRRGETVQYQVEVTDVVGGQSLGALDPEIAPLDSPDEAIEPMMQRVMGFLAINFDERISPQATGLAQPPSLEAYRAFDEGLRHYLQGTADAYREALPYLYQAFELDTTFVTPLIYATLNHNNLGEWAQSDSLVGILERYRDRLSDYDRNWLDYLKARVEGDHQQALRVMRRAAELAPGSKAVYNRAFVALLYNNRPREALDALLTLDPERGPMRGWQSYFSRLVEAYLYLQEYDKALEAAQQCRAIYGDDILTLAYEALATTALGQVEQVHVLLDEILALPQQDLIQGTWIARIAVYQHRLGYTDAAQSTIDRALDWYQARPPDTKTSAAWRLDYAWALYVAARCDDAYNVARPLPEEFPESIDYRGLVGILAACRGDAEEAQETSQWFDGLDVPHLRGWDATYQSLIAAALGDGESATAFWIKAQADGQAYPQPWRRGMIALETIPGYEPLQELMRPKG
jgi:tRNA A-37 threonylcarbamoyl transferase component Bud32/tetratricopeptide (TPR) repeat protein